MEDGIYFGLAEDAYLALERLSKSGIKKLRISPADFWADSWLNPKPEELTPEQEKRRKLARLLGKAYHAARLEPETFEDRFIREPSQADFTDELLTNATQIGMALAALDQPKKAAGDDGVLDQAKRLRAAGYEGPIWHLIMDEFEEVAGDRWRIPASAWDSIITDMDRIRQVPAVADLLNGGAAEVSILYTCPDSGLPMKTRIDYLCARHWVEFKTFSNPMGKALNQVVIDAVAYNRYHIDAVAQMQAIEAIQSGQLDIKGDATDDEIELIVAIQEWAAPLACHLAFQQTGGIPNILAREFEFYEQETAVDELEADGATQDRIDRAQAFADQATPRRTLVHEKGRMEIAAAKRDFKQYSEIYRPGQPWLPWQPSGKITDLDFRSYWLENL